MLFTFSGERVIACATAMFERIARRVERAVTRLQGEREYHNTQIDNHYISRAACDNAIDRGNGIVSKLRALTM